jgi:arabinofuranosyltransferase
MSKFVKLIKEKKGNSIRWLVVLIVFLIIFQRAWMSDDAYITLRTVDNFINGYGLTWNVTERVEVYTHPLWMMLLSLVYFFTHEAYLTTIFLSLGISLFTLIYLQFNIKPFHHFMLVFLVLGLSNAFIDFSTSGLENVLSYALSALFFFQFFSKKDLIENYFKIVFLAGLIGMTRLDLLLMILPLLIYTFLKQPNKWQAIQKGFLALSPLIVWEIFSYVYYGYMFPNTFYAKLNSGTPSSRLAIQGLFYLIASIKRDPLTILVILFGTIYGLINKNRIIRLWGVGLLLYLIYIIKIGGDFMVGRFLTIPFLISLLLISQTYVQKLNTQKILITSIFIVVIGFLAPTPTILQLNPEGYFEGFHGIVDEREIYFWGTGLFRYKFFNDEPNLIFVQEGKELRKKTDEILYTTKPYLAVGFIGYYAGPNVYVIDIAGLGNAFLAHQPMKTFTDWRIGHYVREVRQDYLNSLKFGVNLISDQKLAILFDDVALKTKTFIFDKRRITALFQIN